MTMGMPPGSLTGIQPPYRHSTMKAERSVNANRCCPPEPRVSRRSAAASQPFLADMAKALGHPARIRIVRLLLDRDACVCGEIVDRIPLAQSTVSQHLKILKDAGLIRGTIDGPRTCYCINHRTLKQFKRLVADL
jgi:ArsR family transcriptional regulator, arsenate/arsenite/antimonite-responsive transcriptional repressor